MWYSAHMDTIIYIIGPTASGKTSLAVDIARSFSGDLLSADSIQAYAQLDIISGKDLDQDSDFVEIEKIDNCRIGYHTIGGIRTYLLDIVSPTYSFQVSDFYKCATRCIDIIREGKRIPIVVGGTTLYIKSLLYSIGSLPIPPNLALREDLGKKSLEEVKNVLRNKSFTTYSRLNESELGNKRRLIRKIEIEIGTDTKPDSYISNIVQKPVLIGLYCERQELRKRIDFRVDQRINEGAFEEVEKLFGDYTHISPQVKTANGYKQLFGFFRDEYSKDEAIQRWKYSEYRHAKNQMTYFKKYLQAEWFDISETNFKEKVFNFVKEAI